MCCTGGKVVVSEREDNGTHVQSLLIQQVSAEPDHGTYVYQGFIQGRDYGRFGLQRQGKYSSPCQVKSVAVWLSAPRSFLRATANGSLHAG